MSDLAITIIIFVSCMLIFFLGYYIGSIRVIIEYDKRIGQLEERINKIKEDKNVT